MAVREQQPRPALYLRGSDLRERIAMTATLGLQTLHLLHLGRTGQLATTVFMKGTYDGENTNAVIGMQ